MNKMFSLLTALVIASFVSACAPQKAADEPAAAPAEEPAAPATPPAPEAPAPEQPAAPAE